ncbi:TPA: hypothetical protein ACUU9M_004215 [Yersinia enterocolitica]|uniref:Uncharacterized protein n=1 Tax=Yersinia kristensenii TaxID=28152 RepID=A0AB73PJK4_YERKR|nr:MULTISPECIES: hypothetical protein [Yersinia]HDL6649124.1 hypothetical protein [Yersinia enterocolitica]OVZ78393.1 hypothetical protein CBW52_18780 [Yersinia kristensenii]HDW7092833.1 hypothetical protein [Yersinia enterocolitica]HEB0973867.1 hypothetical protein [Yersinia enterocolitica]HEB1850864.1 hypothetical protein [Yersinia enterocolitica]
MSNSDTAVTKEGKKLAGNAATLFLASLNGGMDQHLDKIMDEVALAAGRAVSVKARQLANQPKLRAVKGGKK